MSENEKLVIPTVHRNGTSKAELLEQHSAAREKINDAIHTLRQAAPHERDYYVQEPNTYKEAAQQHRDRIQRLQSVYDELMQISLLTDGQGS